MRQNPFWSDFAQAADRLATGFHQGRHQAVFDEVETLLLEYGHSFCFDLTADADTCHLIFSPEGDRRVATAIDALLQSAPPVPRWQFSGRRRRGHPQDVKAVIRHLYLINLDDCRFKIHSSRPPAILLYVPRDSDLTPDECAGLADTFLWHALGEAQVMKAGITGKVKRGLSEDGSGLTTLNDFIRQCDAAFGLQAE